MGSVDRGCLVAYCVISFATCYGLWMLIEWGRKLGIAISAISILLTPLSFVPLNFDEMPELQTPLGPVILLTIASIAINMLIIWYLLKDDVKSLFILKEET